MDETVQHETYKGISLRSTPSEFSTQGETKWKVCLRIAFPTGSAISFTHEYRTDRIAFLTSTEARLTGLEWGHRIVDLALESGQIPSQAVAESVLGP